MAKIYTTREVKRRKVNFQIFAGIYDFLAVVAGIIVIIACAVLLTALITWVIRDGRESRCRADRFRLDHRVAREG